MSAIIYLATLGLFFGTILAMFGMRAIARIVEARSRLANDDVYKRTAEKAVAAESDTATALAAIQNGIADLAARMASVEKILKDVG